MLQVITLSWRAFAGHRRGCRAEKRTNLSLSRSTYVRCHHLKVWREHFLSVPWLGKRFTHYIEIDTAGLDSVQGPAGVFFIPNETRLNLTGRIRSSGEVPPTWNTSK